MKIPSGLRAGVEYSLHACDHGTSKAHAHIGFFDSLNVISGDRAAAFPHYTAASRSVFLKSCPLNSRGSPVSLASA